ncbi:MAG: PxKF domain-containing protein, partial [Gaiellaceae bacterium]
GWYRQAVVTTFEASDAGAGLDAACAAAFPAEDGHNVQHVSTGSEQGSAVTVESGSCSDAAGNSQAGVASAAFDIDFTLPTITLATRLPAANAEGWNNEDVTATWDCADELSGAVAEHVSHTFTDEGADQSAEATCADEAGNEASDTLTGVSIDKTKPVVSGSRSPAANAAGWNNENVLVSFACAETGSVRSGIATDTVAGQTLTSEGAEQSVASSGSCVDKAGNEAAQASVGHISIDKSAPEITLLSRLPAANGSGWNKTDVTVTWSCVDQAGLSGAVAATSADTRSGEGAAQTAHGSCSDRAGNSSSDSLGGISIDKTAPSIAIVAPADGGSYVWTTPAVASYSCSDGLSGRDGCSGSVANGTNFVSLPAGSKTFTVTASDKAGNTASMTSGYTVAYAFTGFFQPVDMGAGVFNVAKSGSSIPVKFKLGGNAGLNVFASGYPASTQVNCSSSADLDTIESTTTANNGLTYDASADQYVYVWKTNSAWSGTCRQFKAVFVDGRIVKANFKFAK